VDVERVVEGDVIADQLDQLERVFDVSAQEALLRDGDGEVDATARRLRDALGRERSLHDGYSSESEPRRVRTRRRKVQNPFPARLLAAMPSHRSKLRERPL